MRLVGQSEVVATVDLPLRQNSVTIGTALDSTVLVDEGGAAPHHARLRRQGRVWFLEDIAGSPGTYLNGIRVTAPQVLRPGDHVIAGLASFYLMPEASDPAPSSLQRGSRRGTWLGAAVVTFVALTAVVATVASMPEQFDAFLPSEPPTATLAPGRGTAIAAATSPPTATATAAPTSTRLPTATATRVPTIAPSGEYEDVEPALEVLQTALAEAPVELLPVVMTVVAEMDQAERESVLATVEVASAAEVSAWLEGLTGTPTPAPPTGSIVLGVYSHDMGRYDVVRHDLATGAESVLLTQASQPAVNPAGDTIAYRSWQADALGLYAATADGSQRWLLTREGHSEDGQPDWSVDGATVAFSSLRYGDGKSRVYTVPTAGGIATGVCVGDYVAWSPLGDGIAYKGCIGGSCGIMLAAADGSDEQQITFDASDGAPAWSPDGQYIAFQSSREGSWDLYVTSIEGGEVRRLTDSDTIETMPRWSADGAYVAFRSNADGEWGIWAVPSSGGEPRKLFSANVLAGDEIVESFAWLP